MKLDATVSSAAAGPEGAKRVLVTDALLEELAGFAKAKVLGRTSLGKDYQGRPFRPYSVQWKKKRERKGLQTSIVNLCYEGRMLSGMRTMVDGSKGVAQLVFTDEAEARKALFHNVIGAGGKRLVREFMGLSGEDRDNIIRIVEAHVVKTLTGL